MSQVNVVVAETSVVARSNSRTSGWSYPAALVFFAALWIEVIRHLKGEWSFNPQYGYGWSVPFLSLYLLWRRWSARPPSAAPSIRLTITITLSCACLFLPIRFLAEANPDWRFLSWTFVVVAVTISLASVYLAGGLPWLRHFAFPIAFFLVAVPWPVQLEQSIIQHLMRAVSAINVALVNLIGIPAVQHGNVIEVASGLIGIEEACSGVRSLQATLMISLFLGELFSFRTAFRLLLVFAGATVAFICNLFRTALLVWVGARKGIHAVEGWHDPAGITILLICLAALWFFSLAIQRFGKAMVRPRPVNEKWITTSSLSPALFVGLAIWLVVTEVAVQGWYGFHAGSLNKTSWTVQWPTSESDYKSVAIAPAAANLLRYDEGGGASWEAAERHRWMMFFFRWLPGHTAALFVKIHRPDVCLPASGMTMERDGGIRLLKVNNVNLPVRSYRFDDHGVPLHVFYSYKDARSSYESEAAANEEDWTARGRIRSALRGQREIGAQMLEVVVWGYQNDAEAEQALHDQLSQIVHEG